MPQTEVGKQNFHVGILYSTCVHPNSMIFIFDGQNNIMYSYVPSCTTCFPPANNAFHAQIMQRLRMPGLCGSAFMCQSTSKHMDSHGSAWKHMEVC